MSSRASSSIALKTHRLSSVVSSKEYRRSGSYRDYRVQEGAGSNSSARRPPYRRSAERSPERPPSLEPRDREDPHRDSPSYSSYYRNRFGSHSPEEYQNLRLTNLPDKFDDEELKRILSKAFRKYGEMQIRIIHAPDYYGSNRLAYVNFERTGAAKDARRECVDDLLDVFGRPIKVDPAGVIKDQSGRLLQKETRQPRPTTPPLSPRARPPPYPTGFRSRSRSPLRSLSPNHEVRERSPLSDRDRRATSQDRYAGPSNNHRTLPNLQSSRTSGSRRVAPPARFGSPTSAARDRFDREPPADLDTENATRTLYIGNLDPSVDHEELHLLFEKHGILEDIDIKRLDTHAFAFVRFQNLEMAQTAYSKEYGNFVGNSRIHIGYGKPVQSRCLWVGGLSSTISLETLELEFDRYGSIEKIDFVKGDNYAYILYESIDAAIEACREMKGFRLAGSDRKLRVDYASELTMLAEDERSIGSLPLEKPVDRSKRRSSSRDKVGDSASSKKARTSTPKQPAPPERSEVPASISLAPPPPLDSIPEIGSLTHVNRIFPMSWSGAMVLKRSAYPIQLFSVKLADPELLDAFLRTSTGESVQLIVGQRLKLDQPKPEDIQRWLASPDHCFLLGLPWTGPQEQMPKLDGFQTRSLKLLVKYFREKGAAGVINVTSCRTQLPVDPALQQGVVYAFPVCEFASNLSAALSPKIKVLEAHGDEVLLIVVIRGGV